MAKVKLFILSGVSGAGNSTALDAFEDIGFFCVDNLPAPLIANFVDFVEQAASHRSPSDLSASSLEAEFYKPAKLRTHFALLLDSRNEGSVAAIGEAVERLKKSSIADVAHWFFDCDDDVIIRRFQETRRSHPLLAHDSSVGTLREALAKEREVLAEIYEVADRIVDTSGLSPHDLRRLVEEVVVDDNKTVSKLEVTVLSFGYKYRAPRNADLVVDVRFLPNPNFVTKLRDYTGEDARVAEYVFSNDDASEFIRRYRELLDFLIPRYRIEGKKYITLAVGCTGGRHRSVAIVRKLADVLKDLGVVVKARHRDIGRLV